MGDTHRHIILKWLDASEHTGDVWFFEAKSLHLRFGEIREEVWSVVAFFNQQSRVSLGCTAPDSKIFEY